MKRLLTNARIITPGQDRMGAALLVEDGRIEGVYDVETAPMDVDELDDLEGLTLVPGFIDVHTHGANGFDVCDGNADSVRAMAEAKLGEGVTAFLPTTLTLSHEELVSSLEYVAAYRSNETGARAPSVHIEGPFINPNCAGAQNPAFVRNPDAEEIRTLHQIVPVGVVSVAVEMEGGIDFVAEMHAMGIRTSLAHTAATHAQFAEAKAAGLTNLTHFCNQQSGLHHREIGVVGSGLMDDEIMIELICDTIHLCPDMLRLIFKLKPLNQLMLITDSMAASWLPDGPSEIGGLEVQVKNGEARLSNGALAGSTLRFDAGLRHVHQLTNIPLSELIAATSWNQAQMLGWPGFGKLEAGFHADIAVLDADLQVKRTMVGGEWRFGAA